MKPNGYANAWLKKINPVLLWQLSIDADRGNKI